MLVITGMMPLSVFALGIGGIDLESSLNQPLEAKIEVLGAEPGELKSLSVDLAAPDVYQRMGIERTAIQEKLKFRIDQDEKGEPFIRVYSTEPMNEPFLNFLVEVNWSSGRLLREFTILLDPPTFEDEAAKPVESPETGAPPNVEVLVEPEPPMEVMTPPPVVAKATEEVPGETLSTAVDYGPIKRGENLWKIASSIKPVDVSLQQVMLALFRQNPEAFFGDNVSMLKEGAVLRLDNIDAARRIPVDEAIAEMARHHKDWMAYKRERAASRAIAAETVGDKLHGEKGAADRVSTPASDEPVLQLVTPSPEESVAMGMDSSTAAKLETELNSAKIELTMANELLEATRKENSELQGRISALENQLSAMNNLIELRDKEMQLTQQQAESEGTPAVSLDAGDTEGVAPTKEKAAPEKQEKNIFADPLTIGTIVGVVVLLILFFIIISRNKAKSSAEDKLGKEAIFEDTSAEPDATVVQPREQVSSSDLGFGNSEPNKSEEEFIDPISEADVYIAYGKYDKAVELLTPAIEKNPDRHELKLKLLEVHALAGNKAEFDANAEEFYAAIGGDKAHPLWVKAAEYAADVSPDNNLFEGFAGVEESVFATDSAGDGLTEFLTGEDDTAIQEPAEKENTFAFLDSEPDKESTQAIEKDLFVESHGLENEIPTVNTDEIELSEMETVHAEEEDSLPLAEEDFSAAIDQILETPEENAPNVTEHGLTSMLEEFEEPEIGDTAIAPTEVNEHESQAVETAPDISQAQMPDTEVITVGYTSEPVKLEDQDVSDQSEVESVVSEIAELVETESEQPEAEVTATLSDIGLAAVEEQQGSEEVSDIFAEDSVVNETEDFDDTTMFLLADEVGTKLDLARAYIEMGDKEGAVELLKEVQQEGDAKQKADAQELLSMAS